MVSVRSVLRSAVLAFAVLAFGAQRSTGQEVVDNDVRALIETANLDPRFLNGFEPRDLQADESTSAPTAAPTMAPTSGVSKTHTSAGVASIAAVAVAIAGAAAMA